MSFFFSSVFNNFEFENKKNCRRSYKIIFFEKFNVVINIKRSFIFFSVYYMQILLTLLHFLNNFQHQIW